MRASTEFARSGEHQQALKVVDDALAEGIRHGRITWIRLLSSHAWILCHSRGDLFRARYYSEQCLAHIPDDPWALYHLADVLFQQGETELAKRQAAKSYGLAMQSETKEARRLVELLTKAWPEVKEWRA